MYSVAWEPDRIRWYLDGQHYAAVTPADLHGQPWAFDHDFFLLLNVAVGGTAAPVPDRSVVLPAADAGRLRPGLHRAAG